MGAKMQKISVKYAFKNNILCCGDNLHVMRRFPEECVDLVYIDPPFFSGKNYDMVFEDEWALQAFSDTFTLTDEDKKKGLTKMDKYIAWMKPRIEQIHRVLKPTGSFYLHADWHAGHYLKVMCDKIFGENN